MTEPISVRIARLRGCEPAHDGVEWRCECNYDMWKEEHTPGHGRMACDMGGYEYWLAPAAAFALLSEMVNSGQVVDCYPDCEHDDCCEDHSGKPIIVTVSIDEGGWLHSHADTLGEAIALAWIAMKEAAR